MFKRVGQKPTFFIKTMIELNINTADQTVRLTLAEGRLYFNEAFTNYLIVITREERAQTGLDLAQVADVTFEADRYTEINLTTVGLTTPGRYRYFVYGQNSDSNLDPEDDSVVGEVEQGWFNLVSAEVYFEQPTMIIENDTIAGE